MILKLLKFQNHAKLRICAAFKSHQTQGLLPLRHPHVGALHVVLVGSRPDHLGSDLIQIEEHLRIGSMVCGNFGGASLKAEFISGIAAVAPKP